MDINFFKSKLESEKQTLLSELKGLSRQDPDNPNDWQPAAENLDILTSDRNEVADKIGNIEGDAAILRELEPQLNDINLALDKIEKGTYGKCEVCQAEIEADRLKANPAARTCKAHLNVKLS
ncbi:MAG TPA: TraR/DksA C4-type zinc finger protein [Candidatus Paceibacterota bacterium]|nr:TraR/DksA C4-type zinc finger protein [Candidatus Paceibacterota bacterium]